MYIIRPGLVKLLLFTFNKTSKKKNQNPLTLEKTFLLTHIHKHIRLIWGCTFFYNKNHHREKIKKQNESKSVLIMYIFIMLSVIDFKNGASHILQKKKNSPSDPTMHLWYYSYFSYLMYFWKIRLMGFSNSTAYICINRLYVYVY